METYHSLIPFSIFQCIFVIDFSKSKDLVILNFENWNSENCNLPQGEAAPLHSLEFLDFFYQMCLSTTVAIGQV